MKRYLKLIIMASLLLVLVAGALIQRHFFPPEQNADYSEEGGSALRYAVNDLVAENVYEISYTLEDVTLSFEKKDEKWVLLRNRAPQIDSELVSAMVSAISGASGANKMEGVSAEKLENYGLASPSLRVTAKQGDAERAFLFGNMNKTVKEYYFCEEGKESTVYTVSSDAYEAFGYTLSELVIKDTLPEIEADAINGITLSMGEEEVTLKAVKTPTEDNEEGYEYSAVRIKNGAEEEYSYAELYALAEKVSAWELNLVSCEEDADPEYGFDNPAVFTVLYTERQEITAEGTSGGYIDTEKSTELILGAITEDGEYFCKTDADSSLIYKINLGNLEKITS